MSLVVEWNGKQYDVDPEEFTQRELALIKSRTGLGYPALVQGVLQGSGDAVAALFWLVDQRDNPDLKFGDYDGPPGRVYRQLVAHFLNLGNDLGKATDEITATPVGSAGSASSTASDPTSSGG